MKGTVPRDFFVHISFHQSAPSWSLISRWLAFFIWLDIRRDIDPLIFSALYPTTQIKTKFFNYLCLKNGSCTLLLEILLCMFILSILFL